MTTPNLSPPWGIVRLLNANAIRRIIMRGRLVRLGFEKLLQQFLPIGKYWWSPVWPTPPKFAAGGPHSGTFTCDTRFSLIWWSFVRSYLYKLAQYTKPYAWIKLSGDLLEKARLLTCKMTVLKSSCRRCLYIGCSRHLHDACTWL